MRTIPECREALLSISRRVNRELAEEIKGIVADMRRRKAVRRAPRRRLALTDELRAEICAFAMLHPRMPYMEIGNKFNVSIGRVSEAVAGFR